MECYAHVEHALTHFSKTVSFHQHHRSRCSSAYLHIERTRFRSLDLSLLPVQNACRHHAAIDQSTRNPLRHDESQLQSHSDSDHAHNNGYATTVAESGQMVAWYPVRLISSNQKLQHDEHQRE